MPFHLFLWFSIASVALNASHFIGIRAWDRYHNKFGIVLWAEIGLKSFLELKSIKNRCWNRSEIVFWSWNRSEIVFWSRNRSEIGFLTEDAQKKLKSFRRGWNRQKIEIGLKSKNRNRAESVELKSIKIDKNDFYTHQGISPGHSPGVGPGYSPG